VAAVHGRPAPAFTAPDVVGLTKGKGRMADTRKAIHAYLSPEAHDRWHDFAAEQGVSVSGLLEAIAQEWKGQLEGDVDLPLEVESLAKSARRIDAARRRRQRA
jgi:hypothetical protein